MQFRLAKVGKCAPKTVVNNWLALAQVFSGINLQSLTRAVKSVAALSERRNVQRPTTDVIHRLEAVAVLDLL